MTKTLLLRTVVGLAAILLTPGCTTRIPDSIDGLPLSFAEKQAMKMARSDWVVDRADAVRVLRETQAESGTLVRQLNEAKEDNQKLATHCTELLVEVDALSGKPRATIDQRKDVLDQIKKQMSRMDFAGKQTDQAIKKNQELLATAKSSGGGHDREMKDLQAQIQSLQSEKTKLAEKNANLAHMHKEISSR